MRVRLGFSALLAVLLLLPYPSLAQDDRNKEQVTLVKGLDGDYYEPYKSSVIREVQVALKEKGFYKGEVNGVLDDNTMRAIADFQKDQGIIANGIPTPLTREMLEW